MRNTEGRLHKVNAYLINSVMLDKHSPESILASNPFSDSGI